MVVNSSVSKTFINYLLTIELTKENLDLKEIIRKLWTLCKPLNLSAKPVVYFLQDFPKDIFLSE